MNPVKSADDQRIIVTYDSPREFVEAVSKGADKTGASHHDYGNGWAGTDTYQEAVDLAMNGWAAKRPNVEAILNPLREKLADRLSLVSERFHDIHGYEPDIDRFLAGELECMYEDTFVEAPSNGKVYTVLVSGAVNSHVSAETLLKRGIAIVALVEAFQMVGSDVEIWLEDSFAPYSKPSNTDRTFSSLVCLHKAGSNLDIDEIMMPLAHPSWFRRLGFAAAECQPVAIRNEFGFYPDYGYGKAVDLRCMDVIEPTFTITKGGESRDTREMDTDPLKYILDTLQAQGAFNDTDDWGS